MQASGQNRPEGKDIHRIVKFHSSSNHKFQVKDVQELSQLISEIETDRKQVPILLKHYLKLGGKIVGFNVDGHFSHVLDGLIVVDLTKTERGILERLVAPEGARRFLAYHEETMPSSAARPGATPAPVNNQCP